MSQDPEGVCSRLIPADVRRAVFAALADAITTAHRHAHDRWGFRLANDSLMLKVGPHEVLQLGRWERPFHIVVEHSLVPSALRLRPDLKFSSGRDYYGDVDTAGYYHSNPGSESCDMAFEAVGQAYPLLRESLAEVIRRAAAGRLNPSTRRAHSLGLVAHVALQAGLPLPQPAYVVLDGTTGLGASGPEGISSGAYGQGFGSVEESERVERAAVQHVKHKYESARWSVKSVEHESCGYDLRCTRGTEECHVEVKGTAGRERSFIITANEHETAKSDRRFRLALVTGALTAEPTSFEWIGCGSFGTAASAYGCGI